MPTNHFKLLSRTSRFQVPRNRRVARDLLPTSPASLSMDLGTATDRLDLNNVI